MMFRIFQIALTRSLATMLTLAAFVSNSAAFDDWEQMCGIPESSAETLVVEHSAYVLGYDPELRLSLWACCVLKESDLALPRVKRTNRFSPDPAIWRDPTLPSEYARSGYDRGHLVAAADVAHSKTAMKESFYMSNMVPQAPACNRGIWKNLETEVREAAKREKMLCVFSGPIFLSNRDEAETIGPRSLPVPDAFYKVVFDLTSPRKMIAFVIPNQGMRESPWAFATTVDQVEALTGLDFFPELPEELENILESNSSPDLWLKQ